MRKTVKKVASKKPMMQSGGAKEKAQKVVDQRKLEGARKYAKMKQDKGLVPPATPINKRYDTPQYYKMAKGGSTKKPLVKAQTGKSTGTPFQQYMKTPGAVASDTVMKPIPGVETIPMKPVAKNPKNQGALQSAWEKTYGPQWRDERYSMDPNETMDQYKRRMNSPMKKGGATKTKMAKGGAAHPGFKSVQAGIAAKQGVSKQAAGAILASATRKASPKAKAANPRLKRVKG